MPMPRWWARLNKHVFNPGEIRRGQRPVLAHVGRRSGTVHRTPLEVHRLDDGYLVAAVYGPRSDWVRNVLAAGGATLSIDGMEVEVTAPRLVDRAEARSLLGPDVRLPPALLGIDDFLRMDTVTG